MSWPWNRVKGHWRSLTVVSSDRWYMVSNYCCLITLSLKCTVFEIVYFKNAVTLETGLGVRQGHWICHHVIEHVWLPIHVLHWLWLYLVLFLRYSTRKNVVTLKSGSEVNQVTESCTSRYTVYDFLLMFFGNFVPETHRFWHIRLLSIHWPWNPGRGHWRASKIIPSNPAPMASYWRSVVTIGLSRTVSQINFDVRRNLHENRQLFPPPCI